jgi:hypothetical protein
MFGTRKNAALMGPRCLFCLYFYFIKLAGVNRKGNGKYIWIRKIGLGGIDGVGGVDKKRGNRELRRDSFHGVQATEKPETQGAAEKHS